MTEEQIEAIRKRAEGMEYHGDVWTHFNGSTYRHGKTVYEYDRFTETDVDILADCKTVEIAEFIANAREDIPLLLAEIERLKAKESDDANR